MSTLCGRTVEGKRQVVANRLRPRLWDSVRVLDTEVFIRLRRVLGLWFGIFGAPRSPSTIQLVSASTALMWHRSTSSIAPTGTTGGGDAMPAVLCAAGSADASRAIGTVVAGVGQKTAASCSVSPGERAKKFPAGRPSRSLRPGHATGAANVSIRPLRASRALGRRSASASAISSQAPPTGMTGHTILVQARQT